MARRYDEEFKREAVRLVKEGRRIRDVERALGITVGVLKGWLERKRTSAVVSDGSATVSAADFKALQRKYEDVLMERDILKKAVAIFSKEPKQHFGS